MPAFWMIQARRHLRHSLAETLSRDDASAETETAAGLRSSRSVLELTMDRLNDLLAGLFPGATVVVKDQVLGNRMKKDVFILLVEAFGDDNSDQSGTFVVKIGSKKRLEKEIRGWDRCRPPGLKHDLVFLSLREGPALSFDNTTWMSLVYGDAQQFLGVSATVTLEAAALECVRSGFPKVLSVGVVINELFERIGHLIYSQAFVDDPGRADFAFDLPKLDGCLYRWENEPSCQAARRDVNSMAGSGAEQFLDPVDYLRYVQAYVPWKLTQPDIEAGIRPASDCPGTMEVLNLPRPAVTDLIPRMLRGCAHGDLHGRNVLVGIVRDQAMWPTVFDYEDMGPRNLIGWDFVKLETELKIRSYLDVFGAGSPAQFVQHIQRFEIRLNKLTEEFHRNRSWPEIGNPATPEERLHAILLQNRVRAAQHLGTNHGRPNAWLEEYYFLQTCYGVFTSRFETFEPRERVGVLISAGVAAARLSWPRSIW